MLRIITALLVTPIAVPAAQLSVTRVSAQRGDAAIVEVKFAAQGNKVSGIRFDMECDPALAITVTIGPSASSAAKSLTAADLSAGKKRILIAGLNQRALTTGVLLSLKISIPSE